MIKVKLSEGRGRGIFAKEFIKINTTIFNDYSREMTPEDIKIFDKTSLNGHWFDHPYKEGYGLLPLGFAGLINHSKNPNALLTWLETELGCVGVLISIRDIDKDEEIFIHYGIEMPENWR